MRIGYCIIATLLMGVGWNIRGSYGHMAGAMIPGAMLGLFLAVGSRRPDWWRRTALIGAMAAIGFSFGGASSYGKLVGYTNAGVFPDTLWGYGTMFVVGAAWGCMGGGIVGLALTESRARLAGFVGPLIAIQAVWTILGLTGVTGMGEQLGLKLAAIGLPWDRKAFWDTYWIEAISAAVVAAIYWAIAANARKESRTGFLVSDNAQAACRLILLLCAGWWIGLLVFSWVLGIHFNPHSRFNPERADSWANVLGMGLFLLAYLLRRRNLASFMLACYGFLAGGIGFATSDFIQTIQRAKWSFFAYDVMQQHGGWGKMEIGLGMALGLGLSLGMVRLFRGRLEAPRDEGGNGLLNELAVFLVFVVVSWKNFDNNFQAYTKTDGFPETTLGVASGMWLLYLAALLSFMVVYALYLHRRGRLPLQDAPPLAKGQVLFLGALWYFIVVIFLLRRPTGTDHIITALCYWTTAVAATMFVLNRGEQDAEPVGGGRPASDPAWMPGWRHALLWVFALVIWLPLLTWVSVRAYDNQITDPSNLRWPEQYELPAE